MFVICMNHRKETKKSKHTKKLQKPKKTHTNTKYTYNIYIYIFAEFCKNKGFHSQNFISTGVFLFFHCFSLFNHPPNKTYCMQVTYNQNKKVQDVRNVKAKRLYIQYRDWLEITNVMLFFFFLCFFLFEKHQLILKNKTKRNKKLRNCARNQKKKKHTKCAHRTMRW